MGLTAKQKAFIQEYLVDLNATQAAKRAGYSEKTAHVIGQENLRKPAIKDAIDAATRDRSERVQITADEVLAELKAVAMSNMHDFATWDDDGVRLKNSGELSRDAARCISEVSDTETSSSRTVKFKLHDKISALEKLGKHLKLFTDRTELTGKDGAPLEVRLVIEELKKK